LFTAADDASFKLVDTRCESTVLQNNFKGHFAGVTCLSQLPGGYHLLSGSYDCTIKLWDIRNIKSEICSLDFEGKAVWDIKFNDDRS